MSNPSAPSSDRYFASATGSVGSLGFGIMPSIVCIRLPLAIAPATLEVAPSEIGSSAMVRNMTEFKQVVQVK
eukprot:scaffold647_cov70-Phaeocystis_antarctica.AAC.11